MLTHCQKRLNCLYYVLKCKDIGSTFITGLDDLKVITMIADFSDLVGIFLPRGHFISDKIMKLGLTRITLSFSPKVIWKAHLKIFIHLEYNYHIDKENQNFGRV